MTNSAFNIDPSVTSAFILDNQKCEIDKITIPSNFRAVVVGGGTGAPISIKTLLEIGISTSAIVAMADDGGSTGILRDVANVTAPGDIRKCLCAFARNSEDPFFKAFKCRIPLANNHSLGNLIIGALESECGSFIEAIKTCEKLLNCQGHVYPSTLSHVKMIAKDIHGEIIEGQAACSHSNSRLKEVLLLDENEKIPVAYDEAVQAINNSSLVILGPGSLYTSIIPNLLVNGIAGAINNSKAKVLFVCNISDNQGETKDMSLQDHVKAILDAGLERIDYCLVNNYFPQNSPYKFLSCSKHDMDFLNSHNIVLIKRKLADANNLSWHNGIALMNAFADIITLSKN